MARLPSVAQRMKVWSAQATVQMQKQMETDGVVLPVLTAYDKNGEGFPQTACTKDLYPAPLLPAVGDGVPKRR